VTQRAVQKLRSFKMIDKIKAFANIWWKGFKEMTMKGRIFLFLWFFLTLFGLFTHGLIGYILSSIVVLFLWLIVTGIIGFFRMLFAEPEPTRFCLNCGNVINPGFSFCKRCRCNRITFEDPGVRSW
jgi:hypothetical protein